MRHFKAPYIIFSISKHYFNTENVFKIVFWQSLKPSDLDECHNLIIYFVNISSYLSYKLLSRNESNSNEISTSNNIIKRIWNCPNDTLKARTRKNQLLTNDTIHQLTLLKIYFVSFKQVFYDTFEHRESNEPIYKT